jgi:hypothetical protein
VNITIPLERIEEMALCIVHNNLNEDDACKYAKSMAIECNCEGVIDLEGEIDG